MKKEILLSIIVCFLMIGVSSAQTIRLDTRNIRFGARVGLNHSNITNIHRHSKPRIGGLQVGAFAMMSVTEKDFMFFQPEINFSGQGEFVNTENHGKQKVFMNYVNIPLELKIYFNPGKFAVFIEGGPYVGFRVGKKTDDHFSLAETNKYKSVDFGGIAGIGFSVNKRFELSLRYSHGVLDQISNDGSDGHTLNSVFNIGINYIFGLGGRYDYDFVR